MIFQKEIELEISQYIDIYIKISAKRHHEVNVYITENDKWDDFKRIRSINNHGLGKENILGIEPKYYREVCTRLKLNNGTGSPLRSSKNY